MHPKSCRAESNSMYQRASELTSFLKIDRHFLVLANLAIIQCPMILLFVNNSWKINCAPFIAMAIDFLCFSLVDLFFNFLLWKLLSLKLYNLIYVEKKNSLKALKFFISALDSDWSFFCPIELSVSFVNAYRYINSFQLNFASF